VTEANRHSANSRANLPRKPWLLRVQPDDSTAAPAMVKHTKEVSDVQIEKL